MKHHTIDHIHQLVELSRQNRIEAQKKGLLDHWGRRIEPQAPKDDKKKEPHTHDAYCMKCKKTVKSLTKTVEPTERNTHLARGECPDCGTKTGKIMSNEDGIKALGDMAQTGGTV